MQISNRRLLLEAAGATACVLGAIALVWLVVEFARAEDGGRRVLDDLLSRGLIDKDEYVHRLEARRTP